MLPTERPTLPFIAPKNETTISGALVPIATIVIPITMSDMPKRLAILDDPSTRKLAPMIIIAKPRIIKSMVVVIIFCFAV